MGYVVSLHNMSYRPFKNAMFCGRVSTIDSIQYSLFCGRNSTGIDNYCGVEVETGTPPHPRIPDSEVPVILGSIYDFIPGDSDPGRGV